MIDTLQELHDIYDMTKELYWKGSASLEEVYKALGEVRQELLKEESAKEKESSDDKVLEPQKAFWGVCYAEKCLKDESAEEEPAHSEEKESSDDKVLDLQKEDFSPEERDRIKAELDRLGVEYNNRCATKTLAKELADFHQSQETYPADEEPEVRVSPVSHDVLKGALLSYVKAHGADAGAALLSKNGASRLSELTDEGRVAVMEEIKNG